MLTDENSSKHALSMDVLINYLSFVSSVISLYTYTVPGLKVSHHVCGSTYVMLVEMICIGHHDSIYVHMKL